MTSTVKTNILTASDTNGTLEITNNGSGKVNLPSDFTVGGAAPSSGAWAVLSSGSISGAAALDITGITKTFKVIMNFTVSADNVVGCLTSTNGGSSFASSDYSRVHAYYIRGGASATVGSSASTTVMNIIQLSSDDAVNANTSLELLCIDPNVSQWTNFSFEVVGQGDLGGGIETFMGKSVGTHEVAEVVNAIRLRPSSGTFSGTYVVLELN